MYLCFRMRRPGELELCEFFSVKGSSRCCSSFTGEAVLHEITRGYCLPVGTLLLSLVRTGGKTFGITFSVSNSILRRFSECTPRIVRDFHGLTRANDIRFLSRACCRSLTSLTSPVRFGGRILGRGTTVRRCFKIAPGTFEGARLVCSSTVKRVICSVKFGAVLARNTGRVLK